MENQACQEYMHARLTKVTWLQEEVGLNFETVLVVPNLVSSDFNLILSLEWWNPIESSLQPTQPGPALSLSSNVQCMQSRQPKLPALYTLYISLSPQVISDLCELKLGFTIFVANVWVGRGSEADWIPGLGAVRSAAKLWIVAGRISTSPCREDPKVRS